MRGPRWRLLAEGVSVCRRMTANPPSSGTSNQRRQRCSQQGDRQLQRRNGVVEQQRCLVEPLASHYASCTAESREDLRQVGLIGLIRAAELFDSASGVPFSAYARQHIRGAILHYLRDQAPLVRRSRRTQELRRRLLRSSEECRQRLGRAPTAAELRQAMGLSHRQWQRLQEPDPWRERVSDPRCLDQCRTVDDPDPALEPQGERVMQALRQLPPPLSTVVQAVVLQGQSLRCVAAHQGRSAATVHRLLHRGLAELRRQLDQCSPSAI